MPQEHLEYPARDRVADLDANRQRRHKRVCQSSLSHPISLDALAIADLQEFSQALEWILAKALPEVRTEWTEARKRAVSAQSVKWWKEKAER
jgi:hypothetical protein